MKKTNFFLKVATILLTGVLLACNNTNVTDKDQKEDTPLVKPADKNVLASGYSYAYCSEKIPLASHGPTGWCGVKRSLYADALKDTAEHNLQYPGHNISLSICTGACPMCDAK